MSSFLEGKKQTYLGQAAPSSAWVGSRHLNVCDCLQAEQSLKFNGVLKYFTIMYCHHQIGSTHPLRMNRKGEGVEKVWGGQMRCGCPWRQLNCPSLSFTVPKIVADILDPPIHQAVLCIFKACIRSIHENPLRIPIPLQWMIFSAFWKC